MEHCKATENILAFKSYSKYQGGKYKNIEGVWKNNSNKKGVGNNNTFFYYFFLNIFEAFKTAKIETPTSAKIAIHILATPNIPRIITTILIPKAKTIFS